jgi:hypothetical protein
VGYKVKDSFAMWDTLEKNFCVVGYNGRITLAV